MDVWLRETVMPPFNLTFSHALILPSRACPGKALAEDVVFIFLVTILALFDVAPPDEGEFEYEFATSLVK